MEKKPITRRSAILGLSTALATPALLRAQTLAPDPTQPTTTYGGAVQSTEFTRRNMSSFKVQDWRDHFDEVGEGRILADISSRALHYWGPDGTYFLFPSSVPRSEELTRRGYATIVRKTEYPSWTPTKEMRQRDPQLPLTMEGGDPNNPLGSRAMYLSWPAYLIHGTHDTRKIGRMSSSGCIGLYNNHVERLYPMVQIGTKVRVL